MNFKEYYLTESYIVKIKGEEKSFNFDKDGVAIIKNGKKVIAKIYDRKIFYKNKNIKSGYSPKYPYSLEMGVGIRECESIKDAIDMIEKYN